MTLIAAAAALTLAACNRTDDGRTTGQQVDSTVAKVEQKTEEMQADAACGGREGQGLHRRCDGHGGCQGQGRGDHVIGLNAELAKDSQLSALRINVDTVEGRVALKGTAPDSASRERATAVGATRRRCEVGRQPAHRRAEGLNVLRAFEFHFPHVKRKTTMKTRQILIAAMSAAALLAGTGCAVVRDQQSVGSYVDDATLTTRVKAKFAEDKTVSAMAISVETLKGVVQLSGFAKSSERKVDGRTPGTRHFGCDGCAQRHHRSQLTTEPKSSPARRVPQWRGRVEARRRSSSPPERPNRLR